MTWCWLSIRKLAALHSSFLKAGFLRWTGEFTKARGSHKNEWCLNKVNSLFDLHMPEVVVLQNMSDRGAHRAPRIQELNERIAELADRRGLVVQKYSRARVLDYFSEIGVADQTEARRGDRKASSCSQALSPTGAKASEDPRMGIFDAAALAWMYLHESEGKRQAA